jgi:cell division protein FtsX
VLLLLLLLVASIGSHVVNWLNPPTLMMIVCMVGWFIGWLVAIYSYHRLRLLQPVALLERAFGCRTILSMS